MLLPKLKISNSLIAEIRKLPPSLKAKIRAALDAILNSPQIGKALKEELLGLSSLRVGNFRIIYRIKDKTIDIIAIGPRKTIYKDILRHVKRQS